MILSLFVFLQLPPFITQCERQNNNIPEELCIREREQKDRERRFFLNNEFFPLPLLSHKKPENNFFFSLYLNRFQSSWSTPGSSPTLPPPACARSHAASGLAGFIKSSAWGEGLFLLV